MAQFHWDPETYLGLMREEVPGYELLQQQAVAATGAGATRILELGVGTGETARRVLARHPAATLVGLDASRETLAAARQAPPAERVELRVARIEEPLPPGPFELVISVLTIHHLDGQGKAKLFGRVAEALSPSGRLVIGDVVVPQDPADVVTPIDGEYDQPSTVADHLRWSMQAGLTASVAWLDRDLAVIVAEADQA